MPRRRDAGFTIIEVALAAFVLAFGLTSAIVVMQAGFKTLDVARGTTLASQVAQSEMERLRLMSWANIAALPASGPVNLSSMFSTDPSLADRFTVTRTVADVEDREDEQKTITVTVTWHSYDGREHSRQFNTLYTKNGLYDYYYTLATPST